MLQQFEWTKSEYETKELLKSLGAERFFRPDWLCKHPRGGYWFIVEVKEQERFKPSKYDGSFQTLGSAGGHGISWWQFKRREIMFQETGVRTLLVIREKPSGRIYCGYLDELIKGKKFVTKNQGKIIFSLDSFVEIEYI